MNSTGSMWRTITEFLSPAKLNRNHHSLEVAGRISGFCRGAWRQFWDNRPVRVALFAGIAAWIVLEIAFLAWAHRNLEGESFRAFLPSTLCGVPDRETAAGMLPVYPGGYDGQFYYWQSNDIFGRYDAYQHIDNVLYRYQRIGIPLLAGGLASMFGYELTPPLLYHTLQLGLTAVGFGALVYWLLIHQLPSAYALGWLLAVGTIESLCRGILDGPCDGLFVVTFLAVFFRRLWIYLPLATFLLLTREGYAAYAFAVFAVAALSRCGWQDTKASWRPFPQIEWRDVDGYWSRVLLTALPGVVMLAWTAYLTIHFQMSPIVARQNPDATNLPFKMMFKYIRVFYDTNNWVELQLILVSAFTLLLVSVLLLRNIRRVPLALACALPYVFLTACLGKMVWEDHAAFMKANGTIIILGLFLAAYDKSLLLRFMLALQAIVGIGTESSVHIHHARIASPYLMHEWINHQPLPPDSPDNPPLADFRSSVEWLDMQPVVEPKYRGVFDWFHREIKPVQVAVTNHTSQTWQPGLGKHPIWLGYVLYNGSGERQLCQRAILIDKPIKAGETQLFTMPFELRRRKRGYVVEFSLMQDGVAFAKTDPSFGRRYEFRVE